MSPWLCCCASAQQEWQFFLKLSNEAADDISRLCCTGSNTTKCLVADYFILHRFNKKTLIFYDADSGHSFAWHFFWRITVITTQAFRILPLQTGRPCSDHQHGLLGNFVLKFFILGTCFVSTYVSSQSCLKQSPSYRSTYIVLLIWINL